MCGIFGAAGASDWVGGVDVGKALHALRHRGPDADGTWRSASVRPGREVGAAFAHARLSIIDLSEAGRQPMASADGRFTITFNGEVYNFLETRQALEREGVSFRSRTDTEVVLQAYARWGTGCLSRFRGMFAFGIWDAAEEVLFVARDRLGIKPLYFAEGPRGVAFASEVRALCAAGLVSAAVSLDGVRSYLEWGSVRDPLTVLADVRALVPGSFLEYRGGRLRHETYWQPRSEPRAGLRREEAVAEVAEELERAARLHLISDVPIGVFLSSGVDSSAVAALTAKASADRVHTFTVVFGEEEYSERGPAAEFAGRIGSEHHEVFLDPAEMEAEMPEVLRAQDLPSSDGPNSYFVSKAVRGQGLKVALSGLGGDEVFGGYASFQTFGSLLAKGRAVRPLARPLGGLLASVAGSSRVPNRLRKIALAAAAGGDAGATYRVLRCVYTPGQVRALLNGVAVSDDGSRGAPGPSPQLPDDPFNALSILELTGYMRDTLLRDTDAMSMAHALEVRVPLIDHVVVEKVLQLAGALKGANGVNKPLLQDSVPGLRQMLTDRPKMGFTLPFESWFRKELKPFVEGILLDPGNAAAMPFLDFGAVRRLWAGFLRDGRLVSYSRIMTLVSLVAWWRRMLWLDGARSTSTSTASRA